MELIVQLLVQAKSPTHKALNGLRFNAAIQVDAKTLPFMFAI